MRTSEDFLKALAFTLKNEGNYSNHPNDPGGETWKGVSRNNFPDWEGWKIIDAFKDTNGKIDIQLALNHKGLQMMVEFLYFDAFWEPLRCEQIHQPLAIIIFDQAVNQGIGQAVKSLQEALNLLNRNQQDYKNIFPLHGKMDSQTFENLQKYLATSNFPSRSLDICIMVLHKTIKALQAEKYLKICRASESQEKFFFGWMRMRI